MDAYYSVDEVLDIALGVSIGITLLENNLVIQIKGLKIPFNSAMQYKK